jgi:hypothetical protein
VRVSNGGRASVDTSALCAFGYIDFLHETELVGHHRSSRVPLNLSDERTGRTFVLIARRVALQQLEIIGRSNTWQRDLPDRDVRFVLSEDIVSLVRRIHLRAGHDPPGSLG